MSDKQTCPICGKPNMPERHRMKCLRKSEKSIMKQLKRNKRGGEKADLLFEEEYKERIAKVKDGNGGNE